MYILIYDFLHSIFRWEARRFWYQHCSVLSRDSHVLNKQLTMLWSYGELSIQRTIVQTESLQKDVCSDRTERLWSLIMPWIKNIQWHVCHVAIPSKKARFQISVMHGLHPPGHYAIKCQPPDTYAPMVPRTCTPVTYLMHSSFVCSTCLLAPLHPLGA